jgi:hypothetical protein
VRMRSIAAWIWLGSVSGCGPSSMYCQPDPDPMIGTRCVESTPSAAEAVGTTAWGAILWKVGGGCKIHGCELPRRCNAKTELCEPIPCGEDNACPPGAHCNLQRHECEL